MKKRTKSGNSDPPRERESDEDKALWEFVTRTVRPRIPKKPVESKAVKSPAKPAGKPAARPVYSSPPAPVLPAARPLPAKDFRFDKGEEEALRRGKHAVEFRLDLHGMTQAEAHAALDRTLKAARRANRRTVLVITGKGRAGGGVLRRLLPLWLEEFKSTVLAFSPARPQDGGDGAFYVRLRKDKK